MKKYTKILTVLLAISIVFTGCAKSPGKEVKQEDTVLASTKQTDEGLSANNKEVKRFRKKVGNLKPIRKIAVGKDFDLDDIKGVGDLGVNDPGAKIQWALTYTNSNLIWDEIDQQSTVKIAVIDTGVDYTHPDLKNRVNKDLGYDFVNDDSDPMDDNGHGTHVSGIIGAEINNEEGIVGIVGPTDIEIIPIKALDSDGVGDLETVTKSIKYAVDKGADIINLSLGSIDDNEELKEAINYAVDKGVLVIAAAGNDKKNCDKYIPAGISGVYTISASNPLNTPARFSNFGSSVDVAAPGVKIISTVPGGGYEAWDGTSMAAPVVTGVSAMMIAENPSINITDLKAILNESAKDIMKEGEDITTGSGLIDAQRAFKLLKNY